MTSFYSSESTTLNLLYVQALRNFQCNNLRDCLALCEQISNSIHRNIANPNNKSNEHMLALKQSIWFLKIKCLASTYHINESLILDEQDIGSDAQTIPVVAKQTATSSYRPISRAPNPMTAGSRSRDVTTSGAKILHQRTGIQTGRMTGISSRHSVQAISSYRPLTTGLSGTQTAFSRSTKPLLKYSGSKFMSKFIFEYLYNAQTSTNAYPDYRQCLEYLNLVDKLEGVHIEEENSSEALIVLNKVSKLKSIYWLLAFGICYFNLNMNKEAEEYFLQANQLDTKYLESYTWLIRIYLKLGQPQTVLKVCSRALKNCKNAIVYNLMSRVQMLLGDYLVANASLRQSLKRFPTNIEALANVGYFAFYENELELSLRCFERIHQLTLNQMISSSLLAGSEGSCQLLNNLALCNLYSGNYRKVIPLFMKSFIRSTNKEMTSDIWYNLSFVPLSYGMKNMAIACLQMALQNDSQNLEALNNLGVLKCGELVGQPYHYSNMLEIWSSPQQRSSSNTELVDFDDDKEYCKKFDNIESYFSLPSDILNASDSQHLNDLKTQSLLPEMYFNMALIKRKRGQLLDCVRYCNLYLNYDRNNYLVDSILQDVRELVSNSH